MNGNNVINQKPDLWPTLIIGLGGSGSEIVQMAKFRLRQEWLLQTDGKQGELPGIIQFLAIDTVPYTQPANEDDDRIAHLRSDEYAYLGGFNASVILDHLDQHPLIESWWPVDKDVRIGRIYSGARQLRVVGRLAFYRKYRMLWHVLEPKLAQLAVIPQIERAENAGYPVVRQTGLRQIYIVSSTCGGTGAGMLLDIAHRLRHEFREMAFITSILLMPSVFENEIKTAIQKNRIKSNSYATLKEIEHFQGGNRFKAQYPDEPEFTISRPFDRIYLIEKRNVANEALGSLRAVQRMCADFIFLETMTHIGHTMRERDVNVSSESFGRHGSRAFSSFGVSLLMVKADQLRRFDACYTSAALIRQRLLASTLADVDPKNEAMNLENKLDDYISKESKTWSKPDQTEESLEDGWTYLDSRIGGKTPADQANDDEKLLSYIMSDLQRYLKDCGIRTLREIVQHVVENSQSGTSKYQRHESQVKEKTQQREEKEKEIQARAGSGIAEVIAQLPVIGPLGKRRLKHERETQDRLQREQEKLDEEVRQEERCRDRWKAVIEQLKDLKRRLEEWERSLEQLARDLERRGDELWRDDDPEVTDHVTNAVDKAFALSYTRESQRRFIQSPPDQIRTRLSEFLDERLSIRKLDLSRDIVGRSLFAEYELITSTDDRQKLVEIGEEIAAARINGEDFDVLRILDEQRQRNTDRLAQFLRRCRPFWDHDVDQHGSFDEMSLEPVAVVGVPTGADKWVAELERQHSEFQPVSTNDKRMLLGIYVAHGLNPRFIRRIAEYRERYKQICKDGEPVTLDRRWNIGDDLLNSTPGSQPDRSKPQQTSMSSA